MIVSQWCTYAEKLVKKADGGDVKIENTVAIFEPWPPEA